MVVTDDSTFYTGVEFNYMAACKASICPPTAHCRVVIIRELKAESTVWGYIGYRTRVHKIFVSACYHSTISPQEEWEMAEEWEKSNTGTSYGQIETPEHRGLA